MIKNCLKILLIPLLLAGMISCGSSGGGGSPAERPSAELKGFAVDAQIVDGTVTVYSFKDGQKGDVLGVTVTDEKGFYSMDLQAPDQHIIIEVKGGSYTEEASRENIQLKDGQILRAMTFYQSGSPLSLMVTPFTNLASGLVQFKINAGTPIENAVTEASSAISSMAGIDILKIVPHNITDLSNASTQFTEELKYGFMAAAISSWTAEASTLNGSAVHSIWNSIALSQVMYRDVTEDGKLDGKGIDPETKTPVDLGLGLVLIDANTYRAGFAKHFMLMVGSDVNKTGITFQQAVTEADRLGNMTHQMFGSLAPVPFDTEGPVITPVEAEGLFHNDVFNFSVTVTDMVGLKSVVFDIDGEAIGQAADPADPSIPINTKLFTDGEYHVGVRANDNLDNETYQTFLIRFANNGSSVNLLSPTIVNHSPMTLSGNYIDNGTGVQSIFVDGVPANIDIENRTWSVEIPLTDPLNAANFVKDVPLIITDGLGVQNTELITLTMDTIPPKFDPGPQYSDATFISGGTTFTEKLSFSQDSGIPLRIETDNVLLNGTPILEGPLDQSSTPWIRLLVADVNINGVFTLREEIMVEIQYSLTGTVMTPWRMLAPVITGTNFRFLIPLVSEVLHENWHLATPSDEHRIQVRIRDLAGNTSEYSFRFFVEFVPPEPIIITKAINPFISAFSERRTLFGQVLPVSEYAFTNHTRFPMLFTLSDPTTYNATLEVEEMIRSHIAREESYHQHVGINADGTKGSITLETLNWSGNLSRLTSDTLPHTHLPAWKPHPVVDNTPDYFRDIIRYTTVQAPTNTSSFFTETAVFKVDHFEVIDPFGNQKLPLNGHFKIPALTTYTIKKFAQIPILTTYDDVQVGDPATFRDYIPKKYDKKIEWAVNNQIDIQLIHDVGVERALEMIPLNTSKGIGVTTYALTR